MAGSGPRAGTSTVGREPSASAARRLLRFWPVALIAVLAIVGFATLLDGSSRVISTSDILGYFLWLHEFSREHMASGRFPLWNPYIYGGMPFAANPQASVFYPPLWIHLIVGVVTAQKLLVVVHAILSGIFMYVFLRGLELPRAAATLGALPYGLGGYVFTNAAVGHLTMLFTMAWVPLALFFVERHLRTSRCRWVVAAGLALGLQALAGEPQSSYYTALLLGGYVILRVLVDRGACRGADGERGLLQRGWRGVAVVAAVGVVAALAAAVQLLPTAEMAAASDRSAPTFEFVTTTSTPPGGFLSLFLPWSSMAVGGVFLPEQRYIFAQNWEFACYGGILTLVLAGVSLFVRHRPVLIVARVMAPLAIVLMLGRFTPLYRWLLEVLPGLGFFRIPSRAVLILNFSLAIMAAHGGAWLLESGRSRWRASSWRLPASIGLGALLALFLIPIHVMDIAWWVNESPGRAITLADPVLLRAIIVTAVVLVVVVGLRWMPGGLATATLIAVLAADLLVSRPSLPLKAFSFAEHSSAGALRRIRREVQSGVRPFRVDSSNRFLVSTAAMVAGQEHLNGYMPLSIGRFYRFAHAMRGREPSANFRSDLPDEIYRIDHPFPLRIMNVRFATIWDGSTYRMVQNPAVLPRAWPVDRIEVIGDEHAIYERLRDRAFDPARTVILETPPRLEPTSRPWTRRDVRGHAAERHDAADRDEHGPRRLPRDQRGLLSGMAGARGRRAGRRRARGRRDLRDPAAGRRAHGRIPVPSVELPDRRRRVAPDVDRGGCILLRQREAREGAAIMTSLETEHGPPPPKPASAPLLEIRDLAVSFAMEGAENVRAVNGLSLTVYPKQTLALVGESGCGKSVTALSILGLIPTPPGRYDRGSVRLEGSDLLGRSERDMLRLRGAEIAVIFQEPMSSLNPVFTVGDQIVEAIRLHQRVSRRQAREIAIRSLREVGMPRPELSLRAYPHEFSGGMCQRAMTAMALACRPKLLLADEPTTALDVTIQAQILDLLRDLQDRTGMSVMLITHDLGVVAQVADVVCVMYEGRVMEYATVHDLFDRPLHPYTRGLFSSIPRLEKRRHRLLTVSEVVSDPEAFKRLPGYTFGIVPWWPDMPPPAMPPTSIGGVDADDYALFEVETGHWVGCWKTEYVAGHPPTWPNLDFSRRAAPSGDAAVV